MSETPVREETVCAHQLLKNGIHQFAFAEATRKAWEEFLAQITEIIETRENDDTLRILMDLTVGTLPLSHVSRTGMAWDRQNKDRPATRAVILHGDNLLLALVDATIKMMRIKNSAMRLMHVKKRDDAIVWLLAD
jgi:hypothetical protein